ncbi:MAG: deiodinase [Armatimonadota bacterium]
MLVVVALGVFAKYKDKTDFRVAYIRKAHPTDGWQVRANERDGVLVKSHKTQEERAEAAGACAVGLKLNMPILIDGMNDTVEKAYQGWPDRIYIVGADGKIAYKGARGPAGFKPKEAEEALKKLIGVN